ncbi:MAG: hypothetical protein ACO3ND_01210 [Opitutales bacterium]
MSEPLKVLQAPPSRSYQHAAGLGFVGLVLGLVVATGIIFWQYRLVTPVSEAFLVAQTPIMQHRSEKGIWPADFDLTLPPEAVGLYGYGPARAAVMKAGVPGVWRFMNRGAEGGPAIVFTPASWDEDVRRLLESVDDRVDDGRPDSGRFRLGAGRASFTLRAD